jgi:hypothetical protein
LRIIRRDRRKHGGGMLVHAREIDLRRLGGDAESGGATRRSGGPARRQQDVARNGIGKSPAAKRAFFDEHDGPATGPRPKRQRETTGAPPPMIHKSGGRSAFMALRPCSIAACRYGFICVKIEKILPAGGIYSPADRAISSGARRRRAPVAGATPLSIVL